MSNSMSSIKPKKFMAINFVEGFQSIIMALLLLMPLGFMLYKTELDIYLQLAIMGTLAVILSSLLRIESKLSAR